MKMIFPQFTFIISFPVDPNNGAIRGKSMLALRLHNSRQRLSVWRNRRNYLHREAVKLWTKTNKNNNNRRDSASSVTTQKLYFFNRNFSLLLPFHSKWPHLAPWLTLLLSPTHALSPHCSARRTTRFWPAANNLRSKAPGPLTTKAENWSN